MFADLLNHFAHRGPIQLMVDHCIARHQCSILDAADPPVGTQKVSYRRAGEQRAKIVQRW